MRLTDLKCGKCLLQGKKVSCTCAKVCSGFYRQGAKNKTSSGVQMRKDHTIMTRCFDYGAFGIRDARTEKIIIRAKGCHHFNGCDAEQAWQGGDYFRSEK